jgi:hypothetical protein
VRRDSGGFRMLADVQEGKVTWLWTRRGGVALGLAPGRCDAREVNSRWSTAEELSSRWGTDDDSVAVAVETDGRGLASGCGSHPEQALANVAEQLRLMRGDRSG